jgi:hypothetical protein
MSVLFSKGAGQVVRISPKGGTFTVPFRIDFEDSRQKFIVTSAQLMQEGSYQILHAMDEAIYAYIFGRRIAQFNVTGVAFAAMCEAGGAGSSGDGITEVLDYYEKNQLAERSSPVKIQFGTKFGQGLLTACTAEISAGDFQLGNFKLSFLVFPKLNAK